MGSVKMRDVKKGEVIRFKNELCLVVDRTEIVKGNKGTYWQLKMKSVLKGNVFEYKFLPADALERVDMFREEYEYLYEDGSMLVFMHPETYDQVSVQKTLLSEHQKDFLLANARYNLVQVDDKFVQIDFPMTLETEVVEAPDAARGDTATAVTKLVKIETGAEIRVPAHIKAGDKIKIRVEDAEFMGRVN